MGRKSIKEQRRKEIILSFCKVAERTGVERTSLVQVAKEMGINDSLIFHYFKSKDELLLEVNKFLMEKYLNIYEGFLEQMNDYESLVSLIDTLFSTRWSELFEDNLYYDLYAMIFRHSVFKEGFIEVHNSLHRKLAQILHDAHEKGIIHISNPHHTAINIFTLLDGWYFHLVLIEEEEILAERTQRIKAIVYNMLGLKISKEDVI